jgi:hypothetical protein
MEEDEFVLVDLDQFELFFQSVAEDGKPVVVRGLQGDLSHVSLSVQGAEFEGHVEPIVGTALVFGVSNDSSAPVCVNRKIVLRQKRIRPHEEEEEEVVDDDDADADDDDGVDHDDEWYISWFSFFFFFPSLSYNILLVRDFF